jgi:CCR4-NOT transcription complex subunit 4
MSSFYKDKQKSKNDNIRIIKRNLVYMIGIDPKIAHKDILVRREYLGQYGKITKVLVNSDKVYNPTNSNQGPSYSAYINYSQEQEAALAILSIDSSIYNGKQIKAAFGTTKYCAFYIKKIPCPNKECVYIHSVQDKSNIISKESSDFYIEQHKIAIKVSNISNSTVRDLLYNNRNEETNFPNPYTIYFKKHIISQLKIEGDFEKKYSYTNNRDVNNINYSNFKSSSKESYINNNRYNSNIKSIQSNYYENDSKVNNKEDIRITKTIIKEINYDKINDQDESKNILNNNEISTSDNLNYNEHIKSKLEETNYKNNNNITYNTNKSELNEDLNKLDNNNTVSETREESLSKLNEIADNKRDNSISSLNSSNQKFISNNFNSSDSKKSEDISDQNNLYNSNFKFLDNDTNNKDFKSNNLFLNLDKRYSLFKSASKSKFKFVSLDSDSFDSKKNSVITEGINRNILELEEITECENQSKFLQQYYLRFTFSNLVKDRCKLSIEQDYFEKLKKSICS